MRRPRIAAAALLALGVALCAQSAPAAPVSAAPPGGVAPAQVEAILKRACYDCHSDLTHRPWYGKIPPVSWLIERDISRGRRELNFSNWSSYYPATRTRKLEWMDRELRAGTMPPLRYRLLHPSARLNAQDRATLGRWISRELSESSRPPAGR